MMIGIVKHSDTFNTSLFGKTNVHIVTPSVTVYRKEKK